MNSRRERLWMQRQNLLAQSAALRDRMEMHAHSLQPLASVADRAWQTGQWVRAHPWVPALIGALWLWRRPRQVWRWGRRAWGAWRLAQRVVSAWAEWPGARNFR